MVLNFIDKEGESKEQTGIQLSSEQKDAPAYLDSILSELESKKESNQTTKAGSPI